MSVLKVYNEAGEAFDVDESRIGDAEKDGYLPGVSNGKDFHRVKYGDLKKAFADGYSPIAGGATAAKMAENKANEKGVLDSIGDFNRSMASAASENIPFHSVADSAAAGALALGGKAYDAVTGGSDEGIVDRYSRIRGEIKQQTQDEKDLSKAGAGVGKVTGTLAGIAAMSKGTTPAFNNFANSYKGTAALGGLSGLSNTDADLFSGKWDDYKQALEDTAVGAGTGLAFKGAVDAGKGVYDVAKKLPETIKAAAAGFGRGTREATTVDIAGVKDLQKLWNGIKESVSSVGENRGFRDFIERNKQSVMKSIAANMVESGNPNAPETLRNVGSMLNKMSDDEYIFNRIMEGDDEVIDWIAKQASAKGHNMTPDDVKKFVKLGVEGRESARNFSVADAADELVKPTQEAKKAVDDYAKNKWAELSEDAANKAKKTIFKKDVSNILGKISELSDDAVQLRSTGESGAVKYLQDVQDIIERGAGKTSWGLDRGTHYQQSSIKEIFNRLQKARETVSEGIDFAKYNAGGKMTGAEKLLAESRASIDSALKTIDSKAEADKIYKLASEIKDQIFKDAEFKGGIDASKIRTLLGDNATARRFSDKMSLMKKWLDEADDPLAKQIGQEFFDQFNETIKKYDLHKFVSSFDGANWLSRPAVQRATSAIKNNTPVQDLVENLGGTLQEADKNIINYAKDVTGKAWKDMDEVERKAFTNLLVFNKKSGAYFDTDALKKNYEVILGRITGKK